MSALEILDLTETISRHDKKLMKIKNIWLFNTYNVISIGVLRLIGNFTNLLEEAGAAVAKEKSKFSLGLFT